MTVRYSVIGETMKQGVIEVLMVGHDPDVVESVEQVLASFWKKFELIVLSEVTPAMRFLQMQAEFPQSSQPDLIIVDFDLFRSSRTDLEALKKIEVAPNISNIPIVILRDSEADEICIGSLMFCPNCLITKPINLENFTRAFGSFWRPDLAVDKQT